MLNKKHTTSKTTNKLTESSILLNKKHIASKKKNKLTESSKLLNKKHIALKRKNKQSGGNIMLNKNHVASKTENKQSVAKYRSEKAFPKDRFYLFAVERYEGNGGLGDLLFTFKKADDFEKTLSDTESSEYARLNSLFEDNSGWVMLFDMKTRIEYTYKDIALEDFISDVVDLVTTVK